MNSLRFIHGFKPLLQDVDDISALSIDDSNTIIDCINEALTDWYRLSPPEARIRPFTGGLLPAPQVIELTATQNSSAISFTTPPPASAIGCSIVLAGDGVINHLVSLTQLRVPYTGATGVLQAMLYGDALALPAGFEALCSPVTCVMDGPLQFQLAAFEQMAAALWRPNSWIFPLWNFGTQPTHFKIVPGFSLDGIAPYYIMRLWPSPTQTARLEFDYTGQARPWSLTDLATNRVLDLKDDAWGYIRKLALRKLLLTGLLKPSLKTEVIITEAEKAEKAIEATPTAGTGGNNRIRTPRGF